MDTNELRARADRNAALGDALTQLAGELHAATYRFLVLVAEFDRLGGWQGEGVRSCAHWLGWRCGLGLIAAREKVRVARALEALPQTAEALRTGTLSYSKARAITRIANPDNEHFLLDVALHGTTGHLERLVRYARKHGPEAAAERADTQHRDRYVDTWTDDDGAVVLRGRLPAELGALVKRALEAAVDAAHDRATPEADGPPLGRGARQADALVDLAEAFLASGHREGSAGERYQVVVHVEAAAAGAQVAAPYIEDVGPIADETARRLACDASVVVMTEREGATVDVGRRTRTIPPAIRRALTHRDGGCVFPGCTSRRFVDAHHLQHWADGGGTALDNLVLLCRHHHRAVHEEGYTIQLNRGRVVVARPDGRPLPAHVPLCVPASGAHALTVANRECGLAVTPQTCVPRWGGEALDYNIALSILGDIHLGLTRPPPAREVRPAA